MKIKREKLISLNITALRSIAQRTVTFWQPIIVILGITAIAAWFTSKNIEHFTKVRVNAQLILQYIDVLKWPTVVLLGLVFARKHVPVLVQRLVRFAWADKQVEFGNPQLSQPSEQEKEVLEDISADAIPTTTTTTTTAVPVETPEDIYANPRTQLTFERIFRGIFGTQLEALMRLESFPDGLTEDGLKDLLEKHKALSPKDVGHTNIYDFMKFLVNFNLVGHDSGANVFKLLAAGKFFLRYIREQGLANTKQVL